MQSTSNTPRWVDVLFSRLAVRYGDAWFRKWDGLPIEDVKADWQRGLEHIFAGNPKAIAFGLDHLPDEFPPTVDAFARLCLRAPAAKPALEDHSGHFDHERLRAAREAAKAATAAVAPFAHREQLLEKLTARETAGTLTGPQRHQLECMRRNGMGEATETMGAFTPIPTDLWPWVQRGQAPMSVSP